MNWKEILLGKLDAKALPHEWFTIGGTAFFFATGDRSGDRSYPHEALEVAVERVADLGRPKKIGIMYYDRGRVHAAARRTGCHHDLAAAGHGRRQHAGVLGAKHGYLSADHLQQIFTAHGNIMVFFVAMAFIFGLINFIVPLQIGARDLAFPFLNTLGFWLYIAGVVMVNMFLPWVANTPRPDGWRWLRYQGKAFSPGVRAWTIGYGACRFPVLAPPLGRSTSS
jgi:hypothetical protein